jgi:hypothetical protein
MSAVRLRGVNVDACASCGGLWFDEGELALLVQRVLPGPPAVPLRPVEKTPNEEEPDHGPVQVIPFPVEMRTPRSVSGVEKVVRILFAAVAAVPSVLIFRNPVPTAASVGAAICLLGWPLLLLAPLFRRPWGSGRPADAGAVWARDHAWNPHEAPNDASASAEMFVAIAATALANAAAAGAAAGGITIVLVVVGALCAWAAWNRYRWRRAVFRFKEFPFFLGSRLKGTVEYHPGFTGDPMGITLRCWHDFVVTQGGGRRATSAVVWESGTVRDFTPAVGAKRLEVSLPLPSRPMLSTRVNDPAPLYWELEVSCRKGHSLRARFSVPVYARPEGELREEERNQRLAAWRGTRILGPTRPQPPNRS